MSKLVVNGVEIVSDSGTIDWGRIKNHPLTSTITAFATTYNNCAQGGSVVTTVTTSGQNRLLNWSMSGGGANYNCQCQCQCTCQCNNGSNCANC